MSENNNNNNENVPVSNNLKITIGSASFNATLESNETTKEFKKLLPLTVNMSELNGNEKLFYLQNSLPTASFRFALTGRPSRSPSRDSVAHMADFDLTWRSRRSNDDI